MTRAGDSSNLVEVASMLSPVWALSCLGSFLSSARRRAQIKTPRLLLEPGRCGPFIDAVISGLNDYTHWRPVPMETGRTTTTHAGRAAFSAKHLSRHWKIRVNVHEPLPSEIIKLNALTVPPPIGIVNANVDAIISNT